MFYSKKLKKIKQLKHCFFSRKNGFSKGIYRGLNCGQGSKDHKRNINRNLNYIAKRMGVKRTTLILMHQTHSNKVIEIKKSNYKKKIIDDTIITKINKINIEVFSLCTNGIHMWDKKRSFFSNRGYNIFTN